VESVKIKKHLKPFTWKFVDLSTGELRIFAEMYTVPVDVAIFAISSPVRILTRRTHADAAV